MRKLGLTAAALVTAATAFATTTNAQATTLGTVLRPGKVMQMNNSIDANGYQLIMQADGNLVMYQLKAPHHVCWASASNGGKMGPNAWAKYQGDGNLVVWSDKGLLWASNTEGTTATSVSISAGKMNVGGKILGSC